MNNRATEEAVRRAGADVARQIDEARRMMTATAEDVHRLGLTDPLVKAVLMAYRHGQFDTWEDCLLALVVGLHRQKEAANARCLELMQLMPPGPFIVSAGVRQP